MRPSAVLDPKRTGREASALEADLRQMIVGQDEAVRPNRQYLPDAPDRTERAAASSGQFPVPGSDRVRQKHASSKPRRKHWSGSSRAVIKIDCAEFQHSHEIAKLIGSPPGYLGHRETHPLLSQEVMNQYHSDRVKLSFLLFDEIEKASDALWNLLLGILDKGTLTLGDNRKVDFSRAMIFMTSNLGAAEMSSIIAPKLGFRVLHGGRQSGTR